jgi:hypothetical protein
MPSSPPRDENELIIPHDHPEILDEYHVIRHTTPHDVHQIEGRLTSGAFSESRDGGMSVDIEEWMAAAGLGPLHYVTNPDHGAVRLSVLALRGLGLKVGWDPDTGHQFHGAVWGIKSTARRRIIIISELLRRTLGER